MPNITGPFQKMMTNNKADRHAEEDKQHAGEPQVESRLLAEYGTRPVKDLQNPTHALMQQYVDSYTRAEEIEIKVREVSYARTQYTPLWVDDLLIALCAGGEFFGGLLLFRGIVDGPARVFLAGLLVATTVFVVWKINE